MPAGAMPVIAHYVFDLAFGGEARPLADCAIDADAAWARVE